MGVLKPLEGTDYYLWQYVPRLVPSIVFAALYLTAGFMIGIRMYKTKTWFCSAFVAGCFLEVIGYIGRAFSANMTDQLGPYVIQATFILIPPAFFAATIYMTLGRIIRAVRGEHLSVIKATIITKVFVTCDVLSFVVQGNAAGLLAHDNLRTIAIALILIGLAIQLISFIFFALCAVIFHIRIHRQPTECSNAIGPKWIQSLSMLYAVSILIVIRSIFRVVEYAFGQTGYPVTHEWTLYVFDGSLMISTTALFYFRYPSNLASKPMVDGIRLESRANSRSGLES